jgi:hypothetical protein
MGGFFLRSAPHLRRLYCDVPVRFARCGPFVVLLWVSLSVGPFLVAKSLGLPPTTASAEPKTSAFLGGPKIANGYVVKFRTTLTNPANDAIQVVSVSGRERYSIPFWSRDASKVLLHDVAIAPNQTIIVVGEALSKTGDAKRFMAAVDFASQELWLKDLKEYVPYRTCVSRDETVWTVGQVAAAENSGRPYQLIHQYSPTGILKSRYLQRVELPISGQFSLDVFSDPSKVFRGRAFIACGNDSVGVYIGPARTWTEIDLETKSATTWEADGVTDAPSSWSQQILGGSPDNTSQISNLIYRTDRPELIGHFLSGIGVTSEHQVYGSFNLASSRKSVRHAGIYRLKLGQDGKAMWEQIKGPPQGMLRLVGVDANRLVYLKRQSPAGHGDLSLGWIQP